MAIGTGSIGKEIRQGKPFPSLTVEALLSLFRTTDVVHRFIDRVVAPGDITIQQYNVLRILRGAGAAGLPMLEIGERMVEQTPGITRLIDRLEAKGFVERVRCTHDRRVVYGRITGCGLELLARLDAPMAEADQRALASLNDDDLRKLIALLDAVRRDIGERTSTADRAE